MGYAGNLPTYNTFPSDLFTANGSNTVFTMSTVPGNDAALLVTIDGVRQHTDAYSFSANTLTFSEAPANGAVIETVNMGSRADVIITDGVYRKTQFTATAAQTNFNISTGYTVGFVDVYLNGIRLVVGDDFTANDGSTIILAVAAAAGDAVEVIAYGTFNVANALQKSGDTMSGNLVVSGTSTFNAPVAIANTTGNTVVFANTGAVAFNANTTHTGVSIFANTVAVAGTLTVNNIVTFDNTAQGTEGLVLARSGQTLNFNANYSAANTKATITTSAGMALALVTNGSNDKLHINASGHVTMPYQPAFRVKLSATQTSSVYPLPFNSAIINRGSHFNTSTYRFTAPTAGMYFFHLQQNYLSLSSADIGCNIKKNGTTVVATDPYTVSVSRLHVDTSTLIELVANDYVDVEFVRYAGSGNLEGNSNVFNTFFEGHLIG